jgi:HTH-type transcriptional regulator / antitoxin HigA
MVANEPMTPGQLVEELATRRGWSKRVLAVVLGIDESRLQRILSGRQPIDVPTAIGVSEVLEVSAERLLELQTKYDLAQARLVTRRDPARLTRAALFGAIPVAAMLKRRWIRADDVRDVDAVSAALLKFFGAESLEAITAPVHAAKRSNAEVTITPVQNAWLRRVRQVATETLVPRYEPAHAERAIDRTRQLLFSAEEVRKVPRILAESGIRFVIVEALPGSKMDGACLWLNEQCPVIALTLRFDRIDNFWFVLRHELEHVRLGHGKAEPMLDAELEGDSAGTGDNVDAEERAANAAAAEFCVPQKRLADFIARKSPLFSERDIIAFAKTIGVHPGLVAGQLQRHTGRYDIFRRHQVKIRSTVAPGSMVDGWGDVAPTGE